MERLSNSTIAKLKSACVCMVSALCLMGVFIGILKFIVDFTNV